MNTTNTSSLPYSTIIPVRITDLNYGNHLSHVGIVGIYHQARALFLKGNNLSESDVGNHCGIILINSNYTHKREAFFDTQLQVGLGISEYSEIRFTTTLLMTDHDNGQLISKGSEQFTFLDYNTRKLAKMPETFRTLCEQFKA